MDLKKVIFCIFALSFLLFLLLYTFLGVENGYANLSYLKKMPCDLQPPTATENRNVVNNDKVSLSIEDEQSKHHIKKIFKNK
jgi:hypothetical protein